MRRMLLILIGTVAESIIAAGPAAADTAYVPPPSEPCGFSWG